MQTNEQTSRSPRRGPRPTANSLALSAVSLVIAVSLITVPATARLSEEPAAGTAVGDLVLNGEAIPLRHAVIYAEPEGFYNEDDPTWMLVLTGEEVSAREAESPSLEPSLRIGITFTSEFSDTDAGEGAKLEVLSQTLRAAGTGFSGGSYPTLELKRQGDDAWVGRLVHEEEQSVFDDTFIYDLRFHAAMVDPSAPIGDPLPADGGEPGKAYLAWTRAVHAGDLDALRAMVPAELAAMLDEPDAAESIAMLAEFTPKDPKISSGSIAGDEAFLQIEGTIDGETVSGEATLMRQGDLWIPTGFEMN